MLKSSTRGRSLDGTNSPIGAELAVVEVWASRGFSFARCQRERILDFIKVRERKFPWLIGFWKIRKQRVFGNEWITKCNARANAEGHNHNNPRLFPTRQKQKVFPKKRNHLPPCSLLML